MVWRAPRNGQIVDQLALAHVAALREIVPVRPIWIEAAAVGAAVSDVELVGEQRCEALTLAGPKYALYHSTEPMKLLTMVGVITYV
jgi:hypothetical protein